MVTLGSSKRIAMAFQSPEWLFAKQTAKVGAQSLGAGRTAVKQWLQGAGNLERST
jgi:hypothetical protein